MNARHLHRLRTELSAFVEELMPDSLGNRARGRWATVYLRGLLLDGPRKSIEPMARRLRAIDQSGRDYEQALQQFINQSPWQDRPVRDRLARRVVATIGVGGLLILDDTGFPKQGRPSVGVPRPDSGTPGQIGHCPVALQLQYAAGQAVFALDAELY